MKQVTAAYNTRLALASDLPFLTALYASTRAEELEAAQFPVDERAAFCEMQHRLRTQHYQNVCPDAEDQIIEVDGDRVGHILIDRSMPVVLLMDVALLPKFQNRGIGSDLIRRLIIECETQARTICLHVDVGSPAQSLYERFGFVVSEERFPHREMRRFASAAKAD
jgi:ribosomal protein S18 acetylase RimI-like enzyme